jgi:hypothetical protein
VHLRSFALKCAGDFAADAGGARGDDHAQTLDAQIHDLDVSLSKD